MLRAPLDADIIDGPEPMEGSRFFLALKRSPKHMGSGAQQAAEELASMAVSMTLYMISLAMPEPFISKGVVAAMTFWLMATYGLSEVAAFICKPDSRLNKFVTKKK